ncbi:hypothetical protein PLESTM_000867300 [Pleodorina starrii]|nr:hypothetical protein PLESTM_000867300 [Pleodorina starrii]
MLACSKQRCTFKEIDAEFMLYRLDQAPRLGSRYEHYHRDVRTTLIAKATEWLRSKPGRAGATLYGHHLAEYYRELLQLHFEPEKKADYRQRYARLVQGNVAPTAYLQEALTYKPYLGISDFEFSTNWVRRLDPTVNERVLSKWGLVPHDEWFPHLSAIATDAEVAWNNQRFAAASAVSTQPAVAPTTGPPPSSSAAAAQPSKSARPSSSTSTSQGPSTGSSKSSRAKYWCSKHGWNASHITEECKHGQAVLASTGASHSVDQLKGLFEQFLAMSGYAPAGAAAVTPPAPATKWQTDHAMRPGQQQSPQQQQGAGGGAGEQHNRCDYCSRLHGGVCFIRNPELAPPNYRAPSGVLQAAFHNNMQAYRAKQAAQPAQHAQPAQQVQQPAVAATAQVYDNYSEEIYAPGYPALITCHEAICCEQQATGGMSLKGLGAACATLKQQQVPVTFTPAPIPDIEFSAPKVQRKPVPATEGGSNRLTGTFTLEIPFTLDHGRDFADQLRTKMLSVLGLSADSCAVQPPEHLKAQLQPAAQQAHPAFSWGGGCNSSSSSSQHSESPCFTGAPSPGFFSELKAPSISASSAADSASGAHGSESPYVTGAPSPGFFSELKAPSISASSAADSASVAHGSESPCFTGAPSPGFFSELKAPSGSGNQAPSGLLSRLARPVVWANSKVLKGAEVLYGQLNKTEPVYCEPGHPRCEGKRKKHVIRPPAIIVGTKSTWSATLLLILVAALLVMFSASVGATGGSRCREAGLQAMRQLEAVGAALKCTNIGFARVWPGLPPQHRTEQASTLAAVDSYSFGGHMAATTTEGAVLAEVLDLGSSLSVFAPVGLREQTAGWVRQQGCILRRGAPGAGPAALTMEGLARASENGVNTGVIVVENVASDVGPVLEVAAAHAREAAVARVPRDYLWSAGEVRMRWLRARQAERRLLIVPCATCIWLVLLAGGKRRHGFIRCTVAPMLVF